MKRVLLLAAATLALTACDPKGEIVDFGGSMEPLAVEDSSKVYLGHAEQWLFWEMEDQIYVKTGEKGSVANVTALGANGLNAYFQSEDELLPDAKPAWALYPATMTAGTDSWGVSTTKTVTLPHEQPYRESTSATDPDSSFGRGVMPMVSYIENGLGDDSIIFHVLGGIARIQLFSSTATETTIEEIEFMGATGQQLSGDFTLQRETTPQPSLKAKASPTEEERTIRITDINKTIGGTEGGLWTFYLVLPSTKDMYNSDDSPFVDSYAIRMTVKGKQGGNPVWLRRVFGVDIHRRNITMLPALNLKNFSSGTPGDDSPNTDPTASEVCLVGNGTKDRPFQIYTAEELAKVREAFAAGSTVTINGQTVRGTEEKSGPTYFKVVRSDIRLVSSAAALSALSEEEQKKAVVWSEGIRNFKGVMYMASASANHGGIINESGSPLFQNVTANGRLERVYVRGTMTVGGSEYGFSPLCYENEGQLVECHNLCAVTTTSTRPLAGVCVRNKSAGIVTGCANEAVLTTQGSVAGICLENTTDGYIQGNISLSSAVPVGANIAGICHRNYGTVEDCIVSANVSSTSTGNWGVVVFTNQEGGRVINCVSTGAVVFSTTGSLGGIVHTNYGTVHDCTNQVALTGTSNAVGGIVAVMEGGEVYNCCLEGDHRISGLGSTDVGVRADNVGGLIGDFRAGKLYNSYAKCEAVEGGVNNGRIVGLLHCGQELVDGNPVLVRVADIQNCWSAGSHNFYGARQQILKETYVDEYFIAEVGPSCYSRVAAEGCNKISSSNYTIEYMVDGQNYPDYQVGDMVSVGLNAWVNATDNIKYRLWQQSSESVRPTFQAATKSRR